MPTTTITLGDQGENHVGMEKIGKMASRGLSIVALQTLELEYSKSGYKCELINLNDLLTMSTMSTIPDQKLIAESAKLLIIRNFLSIEERANLTKEMSGLNMDKKAWMRGRVVNKHARWNLCFDDISQNPDYVNKKGTIVAFKDVPILNAIKTELSETLETPLIGELNYYYDISKTGIGWHGDSERRIVIGIRLGESMSLCYNWYYQFKPVGTKLTCMLNDGDVYFMSEKAVGTDWKRSSVYTLRHSAGCNKYTLLEESHDHMTI